MNEELINQKPERIICIPFDHIFKAVDMRTYYKGENMKRKDMDADITQTAKDWGIEEIAMYATTAANMLAAIIFTKIPSVRLQITHDNIIFTFEDVIKPNTRSLIHKAIFDYIVNWCLYMWYHTAYPSVADQYLAMKDIYEAEVIKTTNMLQEVVKRRYVLF